MATVWIPHFTAIQEDGNTHSFVDCYLGRHCKVPVMECVVRVVTKSKFYALLDFTGHVIIAGQYIAKITAFLEFVEWISENCKILMRHELAG